MYKCPKCDKTSEEMKECEECKVPMIEVEKEESAPAGDSSQNA